MTRQTMNGEHNVRNRRIHLSLYIGLLLSLLLISNVSALQLVTPANGEEVTNDQPLFSWTNEADATYYQLQLAKEDSFTNIAYETNTTQAYQQLPTILEEGIWHWQVKAYNTKEKQNDTENNTTNNTPETNVTQKNLLASAKATFTIPQAPSYDIETDLSRYANNKQVTFTINAPTTSAVNLQITSATFKLPFITDNLQTRTFSTFLEPDTYDIQATFNYQGRQTSYQDRFTILTNDEDEKTHQITFNITDDEDEPLENVKIFLESTEQDYALETDDEGHAQKIVKEGEYTINITKEGYYEENYAKTITKDSDQRTRLVRKETPQSATENIQLTATASTKPTITIITPNYRETIQADNVEVTFETTEHDKVKACDLLARTANQQGWEVKGFANSIAAMNTINATGMQTGENTLQLKCAGPAGNTIQSNPRTIIIAQPPTYSELIQDYTKTLNEAKEGLPNTKDLLYTNLDVKGKINEAITELKKLNDEYYKALEKLDEEKAQEIEEKAAEQFDNYKKTLITEFTITQRDEYVPAPTTTELSGLIENTLRERLADEELIQRALQDQLAKQQAYTYRIKRSVAELKTLSETTSYRTGITITTQQYGEEPTTQTVTYLQEIPSAFLQRSGKPTLLWQGQTKEDAVLGGRLTVEQTPQDTYTLIFDGQIDTQLSALSNIAILENIDYAKQLPEEEKGLAKITGAVSTTIEQTGVNPIAFFGIILFGIIIAGLFYNPVYNVNDWQTHRKVQTLTEKIHDVLDDIEKGNKENGFKRLPNILDNYEKLPPEKQTSLSFAIENLGWELQLYSLQKDVNKATIKLLSLANEKELEELKIHNNFILDTYKQLPQSHKPKAQEHLKEYHQAIQKKKEHLNNQKTHF